MKLTVKRPETTVEFCLDGELYSRYEELNADLTEARQRALADKRLNDNTSGLAKLVVEVTEQMRAESATFTLRGMPRKDWAKLVAENPAREGNALDKTYGFNLEAVMNTAIPVCIVSVKKDGETVDFDPTTEWDALADDMTDSQYETFVVKTLTVNRGRQEVPFSQAAYKLTADSEQM